MIDVVIGFDSAECQMRVSLFEPCTVYTVHHSGLLLHVLYMHGQCTVCTNTLYVIFSVCLHIPSFIRI